MGYRQPNSKPERVFVHTGHGNWRHRAENRWDNFVFALEIVTASFLSTWYLLQRIVGYIRPARHDSVVIGRYIDDRGNETEFVGVRDQWLQKHLHVIGGTGRGKTTAMLNMQIQLMLRGFGLIIVDVKGDMIDGLLRHIPPERHEDIILFDVADYQYPVPYNIFDDITKRTRPRIAGEILGLIERVTGHSSWGPQLAELLRMDILAVLEYPGCTFMDIYYFLTDECFRLKVLENVVDPFVKNYWVNTYHAWTESTQRNSIRSVLNKLTPFLAYEPARLILGHSHSSFSLNQVFEEGKILLVRLPSGEIGEDLSNLIAGLFLTKLDMAMRTRSRQHDLNQVHAFFDELQNLPEQPVKRILAEGRAFGVGLIVAHQNPAQLSTEMFQTLEHNCSVRLTGYLEYGRHLLHMQILEDIDQPELYVRPLLPLQNPSEEIAATLKTMSQIRYGIEYDDAMLQLTLKDELRRKELAAHVAAKDVKKNAAKPQRRSARQSQPVKKQPVQQSQKPSPSQNRSTTQVANAKASRKPSVMKYAQKTNPKKKTKKSKGRSPKTTNNRP